MRRGVRVRRGVRGFAVIGFAVGLALNGTPAFAAPEPPQEAVSLIVGLRAGADGAAPVDRLTDRTEVDVADTEPLADSAVVVDVPADEVAEAASALRSDPAVAYVELDRVATAAVTPNDPSYGGQWGLPLAGVDQAWESTTGSSAVTIAVVDTGVKPIPELSGRLLSGYDYVNDDTNATDDEGHGTMTAGVLAAAGGNGVGVAGICWFCKVLPVKVLDANGTGSYSDIARGIRYAADRGSEIINLSLGGDADSQLLRDAVTYAVGKGSLVIAAAGNDGSSAKHYPAAIADVLAVGASTVSDTRYSWSSYGATWVDIAAPGCNLAPSATGFVAQFCGTSSATPFVAGVAGLLASVTLTPTAAQLRTALMSSAADISGSWVSAASGRIDAAAALDALPFWLTGVSAGAVLRGTSVTLRPHVRTDSGITEVTAALNGSIVATATAAPWTLVVDTSDVSGPITLTVSAFVDATLQGTLNLPVVVDRVSPVTSFRYPAASALVSGTVTVGVNAWDAVGVAKVQLLVGGVVVAVDTAAPFAPRWRSAGRNGATALTLRTYDKAGNMATATRTVRADNKAASVRITSAPANGTRRIRGQRKVVVRAADLNGISKLELLVDGKVTSRYNGASRTFVVNTWKHGAKMTVKVRAYDKAGNRRYTPSRTWYR